MLVELALRGSIEIDETRAGLAGPRVLAVASGPHTDPLLQSAYEKVADKPRRVQTLLITIGTGLHDPVVDRLVERGLLRRERKKVLRLFHTTALEIDDGRHEAQLRQKVRAALEDGATPDVRTAAIIALVSASGTLPTIRPALAPWSSKIYHRAKEIEHGHWGAAAVNRRDPDRSRHRGIVRHRHHGHHREQVGSRAGISSTGGIEQTLL